jgi:hypothetical protein
MRAITGVAMVAALWCAAGCTARPTPVAPPSVDVSVASSSGAVPGQISLTCSDPIGIVTSPAEPHRATLDVVGLDTTSTLQVSSTDGNAPHRLFAKTGLLVHAGREGRLTVPAGWASRVSIAWGNHGSEWTTSLHIPACPERPEGSGQWLAFPGGFSLDEPACVPLEVRAGSTTTTVHLSVGTPC